MKNVNGGRAKDHKTKEGQIYNKKNIFNIDNNLNSWRVLIN